MHRARSPLETKSNLTHTSSNQQIQPIKMLQIILAATSMFNTRKQGKLPPIVDQLLLMPAHKLSKMIKEGSLSSVKLCELYTERIRQVQPHINAMAQERFKEALEEAKKIDELMDNLRSGRPESEFSEDELEKLHSPLLGVPISIKESIQLKGMRNSCGLWHRRDTFASENAVTIQNIYRFGMVPICTSNIPECTLYWADCQNKIYGRTLNPYDLSRISGASSGGEGALLGSGASLCGLGSDIAGSLRIPAQYCGIFSHKPSPFLVNSEGNYPHVKESRLRLFTLGPMCRYASDLRPLLKCLISDKDNSKQDTYYKFQPENISQLRKCLLQKLDEPVDLSQVKLFYFNFNESKLEGRQSVRIQPELMDGQQDILNHFSSKFSCQIEQINLDKYLKKALITWNCMLQCGLSQDEYEENELLKNFGIDNMLLECLKMPLGLSKHTKESLLGLSLGSSVPKDREKARKLGQTFEKHAADIKAEFEATLGDNGVMITPTMPTVAYKHNISLMKTSDLRLPCLYNVLQVPVSHVTLRLDRKHRLPFGFSISAKAYNDQLTLAVAEEIEQAFGGWTPPTPVTESAVPTTKKEVASR